MYIYNVIASDKYGRINLSRYFEPGDTVAMWYIEEDGTINIALKGHPSVEKYADYLPDIKVDPKGRISLPTWVRRLTRANLFLVSLRSGGHIDALGGTWLAVVLKPTGIKLLREAYAGADGVESDSPGVACDADRAELGDSGITETMRNMTTLTEEELRMLRESIEEDSAPTADDDDGFAEGKNTAPDSGMDSAEIKQKKPEDVPKFVREILIEDILIDDEALSEEEAKALKVEIPESQLEPKPAKTKTSRSRNNRASAKKPKNDKALT